MHVLPWARPLQTSRRRLPLNYIQQRFPRNYLHRKSSSEMSPRVLGGVIGGSPQTPPTMPAWGWWQCSSNSYFVPVVKVNLMVLVYFVSLADEPLPVEGLAVGNGLATCMSLSPYEGLAVGHGLGGLSLSLSQSPPEICGRRSKRDQNFGEWWSGRLALCRLLKRMAERRLVLTDGGKTKNIA